MGSVVLFREVMPSDMDSVGVHGMYVAEMFQNKLNTPPGFILTTEAQKLIKKNTVPEELSEEIREAYEALSFDPHSKMAAALLKTKEEYVTLRASYVDGSDSVTMLNIKGQKRLLSAILACYQALKPGKPVSIVVQRMIDAEKSGVSYPESGAIVVNACFGLGEGAGDVVCDRYILDNDLVIQNIDINDKKVKFVRDIESEGTVKIPLAEKARDQVLTEHEIYEIGRLNKKITRMFGLDQKISWSIRGDDVYVLHSKPLEEQEKVHMEIEEAPEKEPEIVDVYEPDLEEDLAVLDEIEAIEQDSGDAQNTNEEEKMGDEVREYRILPTLNIDKDEPKESEPDIQNLSQDTTVTDVVSDTQETEAYPVVPTPDTDSVQQDSPVEEIPEEANPDDISPIPDRIDPPRPTNPFEKFTDVVTNAPSDSIFSSFKGTPQAEPKDTFDVVDESSFNEESPAEIEPSNPVENEPDPEISSPEASEEEVENSPQVAAPVSNRHLEKVKHVAGNLIVSCDMAVTKRLKEEYRKHFDNEPESFKSMLEELGSKVDIPYLAEIYTAHKLRTSFIKHHKDPNLAEVAQAVAATEKFLKEF